MYRTALFLATTALIGGLIVFFAIGAVEPNLMGKAKMAARDLQAQMCRPVPFSASDAGALIQFSTARNVLGTPAPSPSFGLTIADLNDDLRDDILVGLHGGQPLLYINQGQHFSDQSQQVSRFFGRYDSHAQTAIDLDNDGDLDIAVAGGGADGIGEGSPNMYLINQGDLNFTRAPLQEDIAAAPARTRALLPVAADDGKTLNLYSVGLLRDNYPNTLMPAAPNHKAPAKTSTHAALPTYVNDRGRGTLADFDADGRTDYLAITENVASMYWGDGKRSDLASRVYSASVADLNNDGALDIYLGRYAIPTQADQISHSSSQLIFVMQNNSERDQDQVSFSTSASTVDFNFKQHVRLTDNNPIAIAGHIHIGAKGQRANALSFSIDTQQAAGRPSPMVDPGIYIWHEVEANRWTLRWIHGPQPNPYKGRIDAPQLASLTFDKIETEVPKTTRDLVFINSGSRRFTPLCTDALEHNKLTASTTVADFNQDGWLDIATLRRGEHGSAQNEITILQNYAGQGFIARNLAVNTDDVLRSLDLVAHGQLNDDQKPDLVVTNGYGQMPGNAGIPRLLLNTTAASLSAINVQLRGANANRFAIGSRLSLKKNDVLLGYRVVGLNFNISQDSLWQHFGLGSTAPPYQLQIEWPDGSTDEQVVDSSGTYILQQGEGLARGRIHAVQ